MKHSEMLARIKEAVAGIDPDAEVILYGSQARGSSTPDSDWDVLVLTDLAPLREYRKAIRARLYEIEWDCGEVVSTVVRSREEWNLPELRHSPYHRNVEREGVRL
jgi:predicted nucleotidyltransferase